MAATKLRARAITDDAVAANAIADNAVDIARLNVSDGSAGQFLKTDGSNGLSFGSVTIPASSYNVWAVKTSAYTAASGDQLICNHASTAFTITLPTGSEGNTVIICNAGAALVTVASSQNINSSSDNGTVPQGNSFQLVYINSTIGWFEV
jgi:hypothetical protein